MHAHNGSFFLTRTPERIPVILVNARQTQVVRIGSESNCVAALLRYSANLFGCQYRIPENRNGQRNEPAWVGTSPLVDMPVVVGADHGGGLITIAVFQEECTGKTDERGEAHRTQHAVDIHVLDTRVDVVDARSHFLPTHGVHAPLGLRSAHNRLYSGVQHDGVPVHPRHCPVFASDEAGCRIGVLLRKPTFK